MASTASESLTNLQRAMVYGTPQECYDLMSELAHSWTKKCDEEIIQVTRSIASQRRMR